MKKIKQVKSGILWTGPSLIDGSPIAVVATTGSQNSKTGDMVQTWIVRADMLATDAIHKGADYSICGNCPHRGIISDVVVDGVTVQKNSGRQCYVKVFQAPRSVSAKLLRGGYDVVDPSEMGKGRMVRLGNYGDPAAVPTHVWEALTSKALGWTGYTHQWKTDDSLKHLCMASADNELEAKQAQDMGWRTFRVSPRLTAKVIPVAIANEITCPASKEAGQKTTCADCGLCRGATPEGRKRAIPSITIAMH